MILLSNLIKYSRYVPVDDKKMIHIVDKPIPAKVERPLKVDNDENSSKQDEEKTAALEEINTLKEKILKDAEEYAEAQIKEAMDESSAIKEQADKEVNSWWEEKRQLDKQYIEEAKKSGYEKGKSVV